MSTPVFDHLVANLSVDERVRLLERLRGQAAVSQEPLTTETPAAAPDAETPETSRYSRLPWYWRVWFAILGFLLSRPPAELYDEYLLAATGREIAAAQPGVFDFKKGMLLPAFHDQMNRLKEAARFFYTALDAGVNRDKGAFYGFLGSLEMEAVHTRLQRDTTPAAVLAANPGADESDLRSLALRAMEAALDDITPDQREAMYFDARSLTCLRELSSFLFDRVILAFAFEADYDGPACGVVLVKDMLSSLNNIMVSLRDPPPVALLESLFVFLSQERAGQTGAARSDSGQADSGSGRGDGGQADGDPGDGDPGDGDPGDGAGAFDLDAALTGLMDQAALALNVIREFNRQVPLTAILRCAYRDLGRSPRVIPGGEDWFLVYRDYWKGRVDAAFAAYTRERRQKELIESFRYFLIDAPAVMRDIEYAAGPARPDGIPVRGTFGLSFLDAFYREAFINDLNGVLRPILIDGEFSRRENQIEFNESYNVLIRLEDDIKKLETALSPAGDYGRRYAQAKKDITSLATKRRNMQMVMEEASNESLGIMAQVQEATRSMVSLLAGIASIASEDSRNSRYDTLSNLDKMTAKNHGFVAGVSLARAKFERLAQLLDDIEIMESDR